MREGHLGEGSFPGSGGGDWGRHVDDPSGHLTPLSPPSILGPHSVRSSGNTVYVAIKFTYSE